MDIVHLRTVARSMSGEVAEYSIILLVPGRTFLVFWERYIVPNSYILGIKRRILRRYVLDRSVS